MRLKLRGQRRSTNVKMLAKNDGVDAQACWTRSGDVETHSIWLRIGDIGTKEYRSVVLEMTEDEADQLARQLARRVAQYGKGAL